MNEQGMVLVGEAANAFVTYKYFELFLGHLFLFCIFGIPILLVIRAVWRIHRGEKRLRDRAIARNKKLKKEE